MRSRISNIPGDPTGADKRNAIAKERQAEREAKSGRSSHDRNGIEMTDTSSKMPDEYGV